MKRKHPFAHAQKMPSIGRKISELMVTRNLRVADVSRMMAKDQAAVAKHKRAHSLQASVIWELCYAFEYNFFAEWAAHLPPTFAADQVPTSQKIMALENEVKDLKLLNEAYSKLLKS
jgi:hypothetical protein